MAAAPTAAVLHQAKQAPAADGSAPSQLVSVGGSSPTPARISVPVESLPANFASTRQVRERSIGDEQTMAECRSMSRIHVSAGVPRSRLVARRVADCARFGRGACGWSCTGATGAGSRWRTRAWRRARARAWRCAPGGTPRRSAPPRHPRSRGDATRRLRSPPRRPGAARSRSRRPPRTRRRRSRG